MKRRMSPIWAVVEMNSNAVGLTGRRAAFENGCQRRGQDGTFVQQSEHADPGGHVEHREHVGGLAREPRCAGLALLHELAPQRAESAASVGVDTMKIGQRRHELIRHEQAHVRYSTDQPTSNAVTRS